MTTELSAEAKLERVRSAGANTYWRSLEELADTPEFQATMRQEFSSQEEAFIDPASRRTFLKLMGASLALSGLTACKVRKPAELILPYVKQPEGMVLGKPNFYASAMPFAGYGFPVLVESHEGRPTKIEGNPDHSASLGAAYSFIQASILSMYDPERARTITHNGKLRVWGDAIETIRQQVDLQRSEKGAGMRILTGVVTSPTTLRLIKNLQKSLPALQWHQYEPINLDAVHAGTKVAFGRALDVRYKFEAADVVVGLDADFMLSLPAGLRNSKTFSERRRTLKPDDQPVRFYAFDASVSNTATLADHRVRVKPSEVELVARSIAAKLGVPGFAGQEGAYSGDARTLEAAVRDLKAKQGSSLVAVGDYAPASVHAIAHAINAHLSAIGKTVELAEPVQSVTESLASLKALTDDLNAGKVKSLFILGPNPVYAAPGELKFVEALNKATFRLHLSEYFDETSECCHWHIPQSHYLESWGDVRAYDGTVSIVQPLIAPLFVSRTVAEVLSALDGQATPNAFELVQETWKPSVKDEPFEKWWRRALHDGLIPGTATAAVSAPISFDPKSLPPVQQAPQLEVAFRPDPTVMDGSFANLGWLQELPKPFTKMTWENAVAMSLATAKQLGVSAFGERQEVDEVTVKIGDKLITGPAIVVPGHPDGSLTLHTGYGRTRAGKVAQDENGKPLGFDVYFAQTVSSPTQATGAELKTTGKRLAIAQTQLHFALDDPGVPLAGALEKDESLSLRRRGIVRTAALEEFRKNPDFANEEFHTPTPGESLTNGSWQYKGYAWGMAIDTNVCNGCNACVTACQAENNIPVVGKEQVRRQREMHWLRVDQYYLGTPDDPKMFAMPLPCMHCENAPCEVVCPVAATVHSDEGTNDMVYNRCVGTRFCSNNCPYKVRRFNWLQYTDWTSPLMKMLRNPDVTPRSRGVMEKCTYCIQRISSARIEAENDGRKVRDGEVVTACQATCPTDAIVFGNVNDPESRVTRLKRLSVNYGLLAELNVRPRTTYLAAVRNPNPEIEEA